MDVKVYSTPTCGYCHQVKKFLKDRGVLFTEVDVSRDQAAAREMVKRTGQQGVPVIDVDGQLIIGFDRPRLETLLASGGNGKRPRFGLKVADASKIAQKAGVVPVFGALVGSVAPSSAGERAGLRQSDIITEVNLRPIRNANDLEKAIGNLKAGGRASIAFVRGPETLRSEVEV